MKAFKTLSNVRNILAKAELTKELLSHLNEEETAKVVKFLVDEGIEVEKELIFLDIVELEIESCSDPIEFGKMATLKNSFFSHSWAGDDETKSLGWIILGDIQLGESIFSQYSENGDQRSPTGSYKAPEFSLDTRQVILVRIQEDDTFNSRDYHTITYYLHIYQPGEYTPPEWVKELAEKFGW